MKWLFFLGVAGALSLLGAGAFLLAADATPQETRAAAQGAKIAGNFKQAYDAFHLLALDPKNNGPEVSDDLTSALACLQQLGREDEADDFLEKVIASHADNWRLLWTAGRSYVEGQSFGFIVAGKFYRGYRHGNDGKQVSALERDRVRALQLMQAAMAKIGNEPNKTDVASFWFSVSNTLLDERFGGGAWRLQYLSDLSKLPDYDEGFRYGYGQGAVGAPVGEDQTPIYHYLPKSWEDSKTDGQRWRWCLKQASDLAPEFSEKATLAFAQFLHGQFGVQTMGNSPFQRFLSGSSDSDEKDESGPYAVSTLTEDETIARLAVGVRRFKLPAEFNYILILQQLAGTAKSPNGEAALNMLAGIFENRQQYDRAAEYWKKSIDQYGAGVNDFKQHSLDQITGNWANFDPLETEPLGPAAHASLLFRNGKKVSIEATEVDVPKLLADLKAYLKSNPAQVDWQKTNITDVGYRLVVDNQKQYLGKQAAKWDMDLKPREKHFDRRVQVEVPIKKPGAYLLTARMEGGNTTQIVLWIADTVIVKKPMDQGAFYYVADAVTGQPIAKASLDFFGWQQNFVGNNHWQVNTAAFTDATNADGQCLVGADRQSTNFQWLVTATAPDGRMAYHGFTGVWGARYDFDQQNHQNRMFVITDRPVYRPGQTVKYKIWIGQPQYDQDGKSPFAGKLFSVQVLDPRLQKAQEKTFNADDYGGIEGELTLPKDATLGMYQIAIAQYGAGSFRVEEYKKPEYEVKIDAPTDPVMLGEKITATIEAKYYFGAPVANAKVKYKVLRSSYNADWYPVSRWDWLYEPGYWWFAADYNWYPGWDRWGMRRPIGWWFGRSFEQPEVVAENEVAVGADGKVKVEIDTGPAKALFGNVDHKYQITAEVTDESRRTIVGQGDVLVARKPFKVYAWVNRGYFLTGDAIEANFSAMTLAQKPVKGAGELKLLQITYKDDKPVETEVGKWALDTDDQGLAHQQIKAAQAGQYRLSYTVKDDKGHAIEGGYVFVIRDAAFTGKDFRFNDVELIPDKKEYQPGDTVKLMINTNRDDATVLLFTRPTNGVYLAPRLLHLKGKSTIEEIPIAKGDMPNFFVEALTIGDGKIYQDLRDVVVPPESRVINVQVTPSAEKYKPGEKATVQFKLTDSDGKPVIGSTVVSIYDKAVEYISGGSNVPEIKAFFWKWRRTHNEQTESNLFRTTSPAAPSGVMTMGYIGVFGNMVAEQDEAGEGKAGAAMPGAGFGMGGDHLRRAALQNKGMDADRKLSDQSEKQLDERAASAPGAVPDDSLVQATVRKNFADTALWSGNLVTGADGTAQVELLMPENLTTWKARVWAMGNGTRVGEGNSEVVTFKNLIVRLQAPRFFVQKDEVVLSANVHNYLKTTKTVKVMLDIPGGYLAMVENGGANNTLAQTIDVPADSEKRVDWRVKVLTPGQPVVRVSALTDEESDAMEMSFPSYIHGMLKTDSFSGAMSPQDTTSKLTINVPRERLPEQSRLEVRYSPSVALAMVDALPYLVDYPYETTDTTLARFLPTVITQNILLGMNLNLKDIEQKRTNLNAQQIGDDKKRAEDWKRLNPPNPGQSERNPVFDEAVVAAMSRAGMTQLANMQLSDGGWGWFSGSGEFSSPHTTALVVHGLQIAQAAKVPLIPGMLDRGVQWLQTYQNQQIQLLKNAPNKVQPWKEHADNIDTFVYMVLVDAGIQDKQMTEYLYRDRNELTVYAKAMFGLALFRQADKSKLDMILQNCSQYVVQDKENQTAFLKLPADNVWWCWYGSDTESMAYYLKLLAKADPKNPVAPMLAKYLINNRQHGSYWQSTRDTAICIEALAEYVTASGEDKPEMTVTILIDGKKQKEVQINSTNLFSYDNTLLVTGADVTAGSHEIQFIKAGAGPLYFNAYLTNFTLEDPIKKTGLEIKVDRKFYKLVKADKTVKVEGSHGQALDQKVEKYDRQELQDGALLKSGDLVEVEMEIDSKNDYEYVLFEDMKAAGFEPMDVRSGYNGNDLNAYMELRDERVCFFTQSLARGKHSVAYRLRAEIPGVFSAMPTKASAMYAPELKANSDETKIGVTD